MNESNELNKKMHNDLSEVYALLVSKSGEYEKKHETLYRLTIALAANVVITSVAKKDYDAVFKFITDNIYKTICEVKDTLDKMDTNGFHGQETIN